MSRSSSSSCASSAPSTSSIGNDLAKLYKDNCSLQYHYGRGLLADHLCPKPGQHILDLGCGTGRLTREIGQLVGTNGRVLGVDPNTERIEVAQLEASTDRSAQSHDHGKVKFQPGQMEDAVEKGPYDAIFSNFVLHWVPDSDITSTMQTISRCLKVGGKLVANITRHTGTLSPDLAYLSAGRDEEAVTGMRFRPLDVWRNLCEESGLQVQVAAQNDQLEEEFGSYHEYFDFVRAYTEGGVDVDKIGEKDMRDFMTKHGITNLDESFVHCGSMVTVVATKAQPRRSLPVAMVGA